ncbi:MAG: carboxypeptidase regulatory-like domain-containing protein [Acidobacteriota bacterium]|nr:carboxypeptidase regulatory-like domain-containing protein [Acidobacteriota bacterium]
MRYANQILTVGFRRALVCRGCVLAFLGLILILSLRSPLQAQVLYGSLTGNVIDLSNAPIPGAKVEAVNVGTGFATEGITDVRGLYLLSNLQPGIYRVTISAGGFATVAQENVRVDANMEMRVDAKLKVAQVNQKITVIAAAEVLQTDRADVNRELPTTQISNLPLGQDRNFQTLYLLVPGSQPPYASHSYAGNPTGSLAMNINGGSDTSNSTLIDGTADPNFWELNIIAYVPPAEAIETVNIVTGGFDAEQGAAGGAVSNIVVKSGTNAFHGAAWEYNTASALQARNWFYYGAHNPKNLLNQFGLDLGGPIIKNKLFFFADWERYRLSQIQSTIASVPTAAIRTGNFSSVSTTIYDPATGNGDPTLRTGYAGNTIPLTSQSTAAQKMTALIPLPNYGTGIANNYFSNADLKFNRDNVDVKINYNLSTRSTFFARYSGEPTYILDPQVLGAAGGPALGPTSQPGNAYGLTQSVAVGGTYTFTPHLLFDANVGFVRQRLSVENTDINTNYGLTTLNIPGTNGPNPLQGGYPAFVVSGFTSMGNSSSSNPFIFRDNEVILAANLSWVKGSHAFRFGTSIGRYDLNHFQAFATYGVRGGFTFTGGLTALKGGSAPNNYNGWADFLLGQPQTMGKDFQYINPEAGRENEYAFYARDQWQVTRKLSIDYGVRYEYYPFPTRDHFGGSNYDPATNYVYLGGVGGVPSNAYVNVGPGQVVPRLGFAYRLNEKTVVRSAFGISTDPDPFTYMIAFYPATISQTITGANSYTAAGNLVTGLPAFTGPDLTQGKYQLPTYVGTNAYQSNFRRGYTEAYNFTVQRAVGMGFNAQVAYVGTHTVRANAYDNINAAGPGGGNAGTPLFQKWGNANAINEIGPFSGGSYNGLQTQLTRRVEGSQVGVVYTYSHSIDDVDEENNTLTWSWGPMVGRNKATAGYDRTHNFQFYAVYDSPFGRNHHWMTHGVGAAILGGWTLSPILSRESGTPFSVASSGTSLNAPGNTQTADQVKPQVAILGGHGPNAPYFDPNAFAPVSGVTGVRFGTTGRNILRGPGMFNLNASLVRDFKLTERLKLQFRSEAYSLTNTPQFGNPGATVSSATFTNGVVSNYNGYDIISSAGGNRQLRFALKLVF